MEVRIPAFLFFKGLTNENIFYIRLQLFLVPLRHKIILFKMFKTKNMLSQYL
jgi:hypothetical protein